MTVSAAFACAFGVVLLVVSAVARAVRPPRVPLAEKTSNARTQSAQERNVLRVIGDECPKVEPPSAYVAHCASKRCVIERKKK